MQKTKMVFTIGPASDSEEVLSALIEAGMSASRHNFSHGNHEQNLEKINLVKKIRKAYNRHIAIILDTKGPEIRTGKFITEQVTLQEGQSFLIHCDEEVQGTADQCSISYETLYKDVKPGDTILIDDGLVGLEVQKVDGTVIETQVKNGGTLSNNKGVNVPGVPVSLPSLTEQDQSDLQFGCHAGVDIVAASFIRSAADTLAIRKVLDDCGGKDILVYSKIENRQGVENIDEIIRVSDGIMVARGDMGVEIPIEEVPQVQKMIIHKCNRAGIPVITATQMLDSMMRNPRPTRAEVSDVANAIYDGTDAIMLSGESASGKYPIEAAITMARIAGAAEEELNWEAVQETKKGTPTWDVPNAISWAACTTASELNARAIIASTQSGHTARRISKFRPSCDIIAVTPSDRVARTLALHWGVIPATTPQMSTTDELIEKSVAIALEGGYVAKGDLVVIAAGVPMGIPGSTNLMKVHTVGGAQEK
jgi:pyruvate kinase